MGRVISHLYRHFIITLFPTLSISPLPDLALIPMSDNDTRRRLGDKEIFQTRSEIYRRYRKIWNTHERLSCKIIHRIAFMYLVNYRRYCHHFYLI